MYLGALPALYMQLLATAEVVQLISHDPIQNGRPQIHGKT